MNHFCIPVKNWYIIFQYAWDYHQEWHQLNCPVSAFLLWCTRNVLMRISWYGRIPTHRWRLRVHMGDADKVGVDRSEWWVVGLVRSTRWWSLRRAEEPPGSKLGLGSWIAQYSSLGCTVASRGGSDDGLWTKERNDPPSFVPLLAKQFHREIPRCIIRAFRRESVVPPALDPLLFSTKFLAGSDMDAKKEQFYQRPPKLGKWEAIRLFLWNSETGQFMGRTGSSWGKIQNNSFFSFYPYLNSIFVFLYCQVVENVGKTSSEGPLQQFYLFKA